MEIKEKVFWYSIPKYESKYIHLYLKENREYVWVYILLLPTDSILAALTYLIHCIKNVVFLIITAAIVHHTMKIQRQYQRKPNQSSPFQ